MSKVNKVIDKFGVKSTIYKFFTILILASLIGIILISIAFKYRYKILNVILSLKTSENKVTGILSSLEASNASFDIFNAKVKINIQAQNISPQKDKALLSGVIVDFSNNANKYKIQLKADNAELFNNKNIEITGHIVLTDEDENKMHFTKLAGNMKSAKITGFNPKMEGKKGDYKYFVKAGKMEYSDIDILDFNRNILLEAINITTNVKTTLQCKDMAIDYIRKITTFTTNVVLKHEDYIFKADKIIANLNNSLATREKKKLFSDELQTIDANGNVSLQDGKIKITSQSASYSAKNNLITFEGGVKMLANDTRLMAHKIIYNLSTKDAKIIPKSSFKSVNDSRQSNVEIVID